MRTITAHERDLILDITGEGLTPLPAGAVEKDLLITEVLHKMAEIDDGELQLIFCGETCGAETVRHCYCQSALFAKLFHRQHEA